MTNRTLAILSAIAVVLAGCAPRPSGNAAAPAAPAASVQVAPARQTDLRQELTYSGDVKAQSEISVTPKQAGRIVSMSVGVGTRVKSGDAVAQLEHSALDLSAQSAQAQLLAAQAKLATIQAGPRPENVRQAQLGLSSTEAKLQALLNGPQPAAVAQAAAGVDAAEQKLAAIQAGPRPETVVQAQANLNMAQARLQALKDGLRSQDVAALELTVSQAKNALFAAQSGRDGVCGNSFVPKFQCDSANASVDAAQSALDQAQANVKAKLAPPTQTDLDQAQAAVDQAQAALSAAQKPYTAQDLRQAQDAVAQAEASLALAQKPYTEQDIQQARNAVGVAEQQLALARQPYTDQDLQTAQSGVAQARAAVDQAEQAVKDATVRAPADGTVSQKLLDVGAMASPGQALIAIAADGVKVSLPAEETQIAFLKLGEDASIAGPALGEQVIPGKITSISPSGDTKNRTFAVEVTPQQTSVGLLPGMFVQVTLSAVEHKGVVVVPTQAIVERAGKSYVYVVDNNIAHYLPVTVGLSDAKVTEVTGLATGASVVVQGQDQLTDGDRVAPTAAS